MQVFSYFGILLILPFSKVDFQVEAIKELLNFNVKFPELKEPNLLQKLRHVTGMCVKKTEDKTILSEGLPLLSS